MVKLNTVFGGDALKADDLNGREWPLTIQSVDVKQFNDGTRKIVLQFAGADKSLICNKTNANRIAVMHGDDTDYWVGKQITLFSDMVDFQGRLVPAIRVKTQPPAQQSQAPIDSDLPDPGAPNAGSSPDWDQTVGDDVPFSPERRI